MAQDKAAEIINLASSRGGAANDGETAGSFLASARAAAGLAIEEVSGATKVKVAHLQAIEEPAAAESANDDTPESDAALTPDVASVDEEAALPENNAIPENASAAEETTAPAASEETLSQTVEETETVESAPARPLPRRRETAPEPVIVEAELFSSAAPLYPERCARSAQDLERVTLIFDINTSGRVANPRVASSTNGCFEAEALRTIARWRFAPRTVNGAPAVAARKSATLNFRK
jgi:protein TonB